MRKSIYEWAVEYCGDPNSHFRRGEVILDFLKEEGLQRSHRVLDVGCGALSQGWHLIDYLHPGGYTGLDPNGWLIEAALEKFPDLMKKHPKFCYDSEFNAGGKYDFIVAHSVLSHVATWQMDQALSNLREQVVEEGKFLASLRLAEEDTLDRTWAYPGVSFFRFGTLVRKANHWGWDVGLRTQFKKRLVAVCPNDFHDWVVLRAVRAPSMVNMVSMEAERRDNEDAEILQIAREEYMRRHVE